MFCRCGGRHEDTGADGDTNNKTEINGTLLALVRKADRATCAFKRSKT